VRAELIKVNLSWIIVDKSVPGWRTIERHGEEAHALERLAILSSGANNPNPPRSPGAPPASSVEEDSAPSPARSAVLDGPVRDVRARIVACDDVDTLEELHAVEAAQAGRKTVLSALRSRISALS
jgi:hypothetical protein